MQVFCTLSLWSPGSKKNPGTASLWSIEVGLIMEKKIPDGEVELHGPNFLERRFLRPTGPFLPVKIFRFSIRCVARVALGAGQSAERQKGTN